MLIKKFLTVPEWAIMKDALSWILRRLGLYLAVAAAGVLIGSAPLGGHLSSVEVSLARPQNWLSYDGRILLGLGIYTAILLLPLAPFRNKLSRITLKLVLLPFLLIPVILVDLVGSSPPVILIFLGIQVCYLIIV
jgi:hypothetical protein